MYEVGIVNGKTGKIRKSTFVRKVEPPLAGTRTRLSTPRSRSSAQCLSSRVVRRCSCHNSTTRAPPRSLRPISSTRFSGLPLSRPRSGHQDCLDCLILALDPASLSHVVDAFMLDYTLKDALFARSPVGYIMAVFTRLLM